MAQILAPALIIMDVLMPDVDGLEIMMTLDRESPRTGIIAFSGDVAEMDSLHAARALGGPIGFGDTKEGIIETSGAGWPE